MGVLEQARLYAITPEAAPERILVLVDSLLRGGVDVVQLRQKSLARFELLDLARRLASLVRAAPALFIVNDHLDIALLAGADGVHLGATDLPVADARAVAGPHFIVGASASTPAAARLAAAEGADYIGAGPAFPTPVKPAKQVIGPAGVLAVAGAVPVPVFAIGGITADNVADLVAAGVRRACIMHGLASAPDPARAAGDLKKALAG